jgi:hypothetical protein
MPMNPAATTICLATSDTTSALSQTVTFTT